MPEAPPDGSIDAGAVESRKYIVRTHCTCVTYVYVHMKTYTCENIYAYVCRLSNDDRAAGILPLCMQGHLPLILVFTVAAGASARRRLLFADGFTDVLSRVLTTFTPGNKRDLVAASDVLNASSSKKSSDIDRVSAIVRSKSTMKSLFTAAVGQRRI